MLDAAWTDAARTEAAGSAPTSRTSAQAAQVSEHAARVVFLDPSGRRWKRIVTAGAVVCALLLGLAALAGVHVYQVPALAGGAVPAPLSSADVGTRPPVVGAGPMLRVLRLEPAAGGVRAVEPFTGEVVPLAPDEVAAAGGAPYVVQRYGYGAGTERTIALTFDDGPDPVYTRQLLDILSAEGVRATFFLTGGNAAEHPDLVARIAREGHAVSNHTLTHADLATSGPATARHELVLTDRTLRAVTGTATRSFRPPYGGTETRVLQDGVSGLLQAQRLGYLISSYDFDTLDWRYSETARGGGAGSGANAAGSIPLPELDGRPITVLMHDGGDRNRERTIAYVRDELIPAARAAGYTFATMPQVIPVLAESTSTVEPSLADRVGRRWAEVLAVWPERLIGLLFAFALSSVVVVGLGNVVLALVRRSRRPRYDGDLPDLGVSVLIAAYNEEEVIARTLRTLLDSTYPVLEIVVVDDGSKDRTSAEVEAVAAQDSRVRLVRQANAGKWAALNNGLAQLRGGIVVTLDADTVFTPDTVGNLVRQFALPGSERLGAVAGVVRVGNRGLNLLTRWQALEYLTQIGVERAAYAQLGAVPVIPGACAAWRREAILAAGGYSDATLAEDCDLTLALHRAGWQVSQDDEAVAYTEAPDHVDALLAQRIRWTFGTLQAIAKHRDMLLRPRFGWLGMVVLPYMAVSIVVPLMFLPFIAVMAVLAVQQQGWMLVGGYFLAFTAVHAVIATVAVRLLGERMHHLLMIPIYRLVYEPLRAYLLYTSAYSAVRGVKLGWNKLQRTGAMDASVGGAPAGAAPAVATAGGSGSNGTAAGAGAPQPARVIVLPDAPALAGVPGLAWTPEPAPASHGPASHGPASHDPALAVPAPVGSSAARDVTVRPAPVADPSRTLEAMPR